MKKYYILFCYSETVGGGQNYANSKVSWLKENGWQPIVITVSMVSRFFKVIKKREIPWMELRNYSRMRSSYLSMSPENWPGWLVKREVNRMAALVPKDAEEIIIESHTDYWAEWGELLAKRLNAKNFCFLLEEILELSVAKEFLYFKFLRKELAGIHETSVHRLFVGYKNVPIGDEYVLRASNSGAIADIESDVVSAVKKCDFNIAYMGRHKQYVENVIEGVVKFAKSHSNKTVNFIILGEMKDFLFRKISMPDNLVVTKLGFLSPIPRLFFSKVDVVIAGSGCAGISARQNVPVIVANAEARLASGILGYTTESTLFTETAEYKPFDEALEDVLIRQIHKNMNFYLPSGRTLDSVYGEHFDFIEKSEAKQEYFDLVRYPQGNRDPLNGFLTVLKFNINGAVNFAMGLIRK